MELKEGTRVFMSDGKEVGTIKRFVTDPSTNEIAHIVVQKGGLFSEDKAVPFEMVNSALTCSGATCLFQRISMKKYYPVLAAAMALLFYTFADILIWQRIFETNQMVQYADIYHTGWFVSLGGYAILGIVFMWGAWKDCLYFLVALFVGAFSGLEDVLYYILDGKSMPESLPWLAENPMIFHVSREGVIWSVSLWLVALVLLYLLLYQWRAKARKSFSNEPESMLGTSQDMSNSFDGSLQDQHGKYQEM